LEVDEFVNGDNFGERSVIEKVPIEYSVMTTIPTEVLILEDQELMKLAFCKKVKSMLMANTKSFPEDIDLRRSLIEMNKWNTYKKGLTKSIASERNNRKNSMES
jgi:CRP-like cAMP-binding protein